MEYSIIKTFDNDENGIVELVEDTNGKKFVRRTMQGKIEIYLALKQISHKYLPQIISAEYDGKQTITIEEYINSIGDMSILSRERDIVNAFCELCRVLEFIHAREIIHRDIKPSNVLIADDGHIRLIDFDAARRYKEDSSRDTRYLGTKGYAAPEQFGFSQTGYTADIYALGVTMKTVMEKRADSRKYKRIIRKCTEFDPENRYQSASSVRRSLELSKYRMIVEILGGVLILLGLSAAGGLIASDYKIYGNISYTETQMIKDEDITVNTSSAIAQTEQLSTYYTESQLHGQWIPVCELDSFDIEEINKWLDEESDTFTHDKNIPLKAIMCYDAGKYFAVFDYDTINGNWSEDGLEYDNGNGIMEQWITDRNGETYLFLENKLYGDSYIGPTGCIVAKKWDVDSVSPSETAKIAEYIKIIKEDGVNGTVYADSLKEEYNFVPDPVLTGEWIAVDHIDAFDPYWIYDKNKDKSQLWYKKAVFNDDGSWSYYTNDGMECYDDIWTYGLAFSGEYINEYMIHSINGEEYLYIEDKTGAYKTEDTYENSYYIFKRN